MPQTYSIRRGDTESNTATPIGKVEGDMRPILIAFLVILSGSTGFADNNKFTEILHAHRHATDFHAWQVDPHNPKNLLPQWLVENSDLHLPDEICESMRSLSSEDLLIFYAFLTETEEGQTLPCTLDLTDKIDRYVSHKKMTTRSLQFRRPLQQKHFSHRSLKSSKSGTRRIPIATDGGPVLVTGDLRVGEVALTFDDGPHVKWTPDILQTLSEHNTQAGFFTVGQNVRRHPQLVVDEAHQGHIIGNHTWSHKQLPKISYGSALKEINDGFVAIHEALNFDTPLFRFPYGARTSHLRSYLKNSDVSEFFWNMDTLDWKIKDPEKLLDYAIKQLDAAERGIILFHDVQPQTAAALPSFLLALQQRGYQTVVFVPEDWPHTLPENPLP